MLRKGISLRLCRDKMGSIMSPSLIPKMNLHNLTHITLMLLSAELFVIAYTVSLRLVTTRCALCALSLLFTAWEGSRQYGVILISQLLTSIKE